MKKFICLTVGLLALALAPVFGQPKAKPPTPISAPSLPPPHAFSAPITPEQQMIAIAAAHAHNQEKPSLTKFNLDFPGGTPTALVKAIEKASGKSLNAIIPTEDADIQLPPLKMNDVVTPQLFAALRAASVKIVAVQNHTFGQPYSQVSTDYGFETSDSPITDTSIWYFHADKPSLPPVVSTERVCRFYSLAPYLSTNLTVDDITTAIQTGWKMAGIASPPKLEYHKETKLLIAYGDPSQLQTIEDVLHALPKPAVNVWKTLELEKKAMSILNSNSTSPPSSNKEKSGI